MGEPPAHSGFGAEMRVDWLSADDLRDHRPGRLGLTFLPGKRGASVRYPGHVYQREVTADLQALRDRGVRRLVLLVTDGELARWGDPRIVELGRDIGVQVTRYPMPDGSPPGSLDAINAILADVAETRAQGDVAVACMGGVGRSGTVAACALVAAGWEAEPAIRRIREVRHPEAVETRAQERFVERFGLSLEAGGASPGRRRARS